MRNIYLVERENWVDQTCDAFVICADSEQQALSIACYEEKDTIQEDWSTSHVGITDTTERGVVLGSYNYAD